MKSLVCNSVGTNMEGVCLYVKELMWLFIFHKKLCLWHCRSVEAALSLSATCCIHCHIFSPPWSAVYLPYVCRLEPLACAIMEIRPICFRLFHFNHTPLECSTNLAVLLRFPREQSSVRLKIPQTRARRTKRRYFAIAPWEQEQSFYGACPKLNGSKCGKKLSLTPLHHKPPESFIQSRRDLCWMMTQMQGKGGRKQTVVGIKV